jgi:membrane-bound metal-dependent hydrolase YbcI (DUF457 family)
MLFYTHLAFALLTALYFMPEQILLVLLGAMIPDIDNMHSTINRKLYFTRLFTYFFGHRGFCHTLWFGLVLFIIISYLMPKYAGAVLLGFASHLVADSLTKYGVNYLHPIATFRINGFIETGKGGEKLVLIGIILMIGFKLFF